MEEETSFAGQIIKYGLWIIAAGLIIAALYTIFRKFGIL
jgi:hypothetical protein